MIMFSMGSVGTNNRLVTPKQKKRSLITLIVMGAIIFVIGMGLLIGYFVGGKNDYVEISTPFYYRCDYVGGSKPYNYTITGEIKNKTDRGIYVSLKGEIEDSEHRGLFDDEPGYIEAGATYRVELILEGNYAYDEVSLIEVSVNGGAYETLYSSDRVYMSYMAYGLLAIGAALTAGFSVGLVKHNKKVAAGELTETANQDANGWTSIDGKAPEKTENAQTDAKEDKKVCSYCGTKNDAKADKCSGCGGKLD